MKYFDTIFLEEAHAFLVVATHGFVKKVDKVPNREIERAIIARKEYFLNK